MKKIIDAKNVVKTFGEKEEKILVLKGIDLQIAQGEFVAIMGASGSGKSTLLYTLSAIEEAESGEILIDDIDLAGLTHDQKAALRRKDFGFVFQNPTMLKNLNIIENILLQASYEKSSDRKELMQRAKLLMEKTGIAGLEKRSITEVSGGQLQRAGICRAILHQPKIVFADEPTGALDSKSGEEIKELFTQIHQEGMTILLVTHDRQVASIAERMIMMKDGEIRGEISLRGLSKEDRLSEIDALIHEIL